ncbi:hypothetical protein CPC16_005157 [Podila verticillata]|nr:hypothetical protein BGZ52_012616 [Haplosporangium bisporale]KAF9213016.1 hypothetical protein BGZ59_006015 [Podila verticillata]KAF9390302.1 hypothetical protein CPC16_005157 [Podila verticillata]KFH66633.1 hypothetical protein MVEG_07158 [Podila verticillata NRRL 6337]
MSIRLINTSREVIEFPTVQEAYDFVLSLDPPMAFRTDAPESVCIPIDPESSPSQLSLRTYAILPLTDKEKVAMRNKLHSMVNEIKQGAGIPGLSDMDADLISALAQSAESSESGNAEPSSSK